VLASPGVGGGSGGGALSCRGARLAVALLYTQMCLEKPLDGASRGWAVMPGCLESRCRLLAAARGLLAAYLCPAIPNEEVCIGKEP
jgi:hypothetical protein